MKYSDFKQSILYEACDKASQNYRMAIDLIKDPDNFETIKRQKHGKRVKKFLRIVDTLFGTFSVLNSHDHTQILESCFINMSENHVLKCSEYLNHIVKLKTRPRQKLVLYINEIEEYAYFVNEKVL